MRVRDSGTPFKSNTTTVKINVNRNFQVPRWDQSRYTQNIDESMIIGTEVVVVRATDQDRKVGPSYHF